MVQSITTSSLEMEILMTELKRLWPKLKKIMNKSSASRKKTGEIFFRESYIVLIQKNSPQGPFNLEHLDMVLSYAKSFFQFANIEIAKIAKIMYSRTD